MIILMWAHQNLPFPDFYLNRPLLFAHRGVRELAPENSLLSFETAYALGADGIELDVQLSADGQLIIYHDKNLKRLTLSNKNVIELTLADLKALDIGEHFGTASRGMQIPTLDEVFDGFGKRLLFNVELKTVRSRQEELAREVAACIQRHDLETRAIVSSFDMAGLRFMRLAALELQLGQLVIRPPKLHSHLPQWMRRGPMDFVEAVHPNCRFVNQEFVRKAHSAGLRVNVWTVNSPDELQRMLDAKVDMIITDALSIAQNIINPQPNVLEQPPRSHDSSAN